MEVGVAEGRLATVAIWLMFDVGYLLQSRSHVRAVLRILHGISIWILGGNQITIQIVVRYGTEYLTYDCIGIKIRNKHPNRTRHGRNIQHYYESDILNVHWVKGARWAHTTRTTIHPRQHCGITILPLSLTRIQTNGDSAVRNKIREIPIAIRSKKV